MSGSSGRFRAAISLGPIPVYGRDLPHGAPGSNGMDAPTLNGIDVPKWKC